MPTVRHVGNSIFHAAWGEPPHVPSDRRYAVAFASLLLLSARSPLKIAPQYNAVILRGVPFLF